MTTKAPTTTVDHSRSYPVFPLKNEKKSTKTKRLVIFMFI